MEIYIQFHNKENTIRKTLQQSYKYNLSKRVREIKPKGQSSKNNPETLSALVTQDTAQRQIEHKNTKLKI